MYNSDLADQIENAVENALVTSDFSKLNKSITTAVNTSIAQIGTNQHRFYQQYENDETTMEQLEHVDGEIVNGDARADFTARRRAARAEEERARYNSRQAQEARRQAAETRRREEAARRQQARRQSAQNGTPRGGSGQRAQNHDFVNLWQTAREKSNFRPHGQNYGYSQEQQRRNPANIVPISRNPAGRVAGTLLTVFGALGLGGCLLMFMLLNIFMHSGVMSYYAYDVLTSIFTPCLFVSGGMLIAGTVKRRRIQRFYRYVRQLRGRTYCSIRELSSHIGRSRRFVLKDLRKMIALGMFPEGHIDDQQTCVMLNGATYDQYLKAQNSYLARQMEQRRSAGRIRGGNGDDFVRENGSRGAADTDGSYGAFYGAPDSSSNGRTSGFSAAGSADGAASNSFAAGSAGTASSSAAGSAGKRRDRSSLPPKVLQVLSAGDSYLTQIREANAAIPGEVISGKLDHLEKIIQKIYARIEEHPEQVEDLDKFINYYLPTTLKLVNAYRSFDAQSVQGDNIQTAKKEIESTLDTINYAFETLLDSLYEDDALDISTDISVLQTMFAQEGLTKGAFDK